MNARERLRQYLEQRREAGETELVFDQLSVEEAMKLLGAGGRRPTPQQASRPPWPRDASYRRRGVIPNRPSRVSPETGGACCAKRVPIRRRPDRSRPRADTSEG